MSGGIFVSGHVSIAFNDDFDWTAESLFAHCALHEIGHSIGRPFARQSLSYVATTPNYNAFHPLHPDDVTGIHKIYGWREPKWHDKIENPTSPVSSLIFHCQRPSTATTLPCPASARKVKQMAVGSSGKKRSTSCTRTAASGRPRHPTTASGRCWTATRRQCHRRWRRRRVLQTAPQRPDLLLIQLLVGEANRRLRRRGRSWRRGYICTRGIRTGLSGAIPARRACRSSWIRIRNG